jgi:Ca2+-binding RTX toxin-like protein
MARGVLTRWKGGKMYSAGRRLAVATAALAATAALVVGVSASAASTPWPTCLGEPATIVGTDGNDTIAGTSGDDVIASLGGDDVITSGGSSDTDLICGGDGNDTLMATPGGDSFFDWAVMSGDAGDDRIQGNEDTFTEVDYEDSPEPVTVDLGAATESGWGNDTLVRVDFVDGSQYNDVLTGSNYFNGLYGNAGDDTISGLGGVDDLGGGAGVNSIDGGSGSDWLDYWDAPSGVHADLAKGTAGSGWGTDSFRSIENIYGSKHADTFVGNAGRNVINGNKGNDRLYGGKGRDFLDGQSGKDRADGGPARDQCRAEKKIHCP